jgi:hypothetical protein
MGKRGKKMTNDQTRMTNQIPMTNAQPEAPLHWTLVLGHSLVIRIWTLVIQERPYLAFATQAGAGPE